ncbi:MAG: hypothetical protein K2X68_07900, partial [Novosphingobium sp.]|nr:hypothetical protein [Novosphingobium sp.]
PATTLALPDPGGKAPFVQAYWHYARGEAYARLGNAAAVRAEAAAIIMPTKVKITPDTAKGWTAARDMARIARLVLIGRAAMLDHQPAVAAKAFSRAVTYEESAAVTHYADPPAWWYPVRRSLAAALLESGQPAAALVQVNKALARRPLDPVTTGLRGKILAALGDSERAARDADMAAKNWRGDRSALSAPLL